MNDSPSTIRDEATARRGRPEVVSLTDLVAFVDRWWLLIVALAAVGALVALVSMVFMSRDVYRATATLVVVPPPIASELKPPTLTVQGYQKLLESDAVIAAARTRLAAEGVVSADFPLAIGRNLSTEIFVSRRAEEQELAPLLRAVATAGDPEVAAAIANAWAGVFLERTRELVAGSTSPAVSYIEEEYPRARSRVGALEREHVAAANEHQERYDATASSWDDRIATFKGDQARAVATFEAETARLLSTRAAELGLEGRAETIDSLHAAAALLQREQATVGARLAQRRDELAVARDLLKATPPTLYVSKAITDDALWTAISQSTESGAQWDQLRDRLLVTEEPNPLHLEASRRVAVLEVEVAGLDPRAEELTAQLEELGEEVRRLETALAHASSEVTALEQDRAAGLISLTERGDVTTTVMKRDRARALAKIERDRDADLAALDRDLDQSRALFEEMTVHYNQALIAQAQSEVEDVRLGAEAVPPTETEPGPGAMGVLLGAMLGGLLALVIAVFREARPRDLEADR